MCFCAVRCNTLQHPATHCNDRGVRGYFLYLHVSGVCVFDCATPCNTLQHTATHCNTLQQQRCTWMHASPYLDASTSSPAPFPAPSPCQRRSRPSEIQNRKLSSHSDSGVCDSHVVRGPHVVRGSNVGRGSGPYKIEEHALRHSYCGLRVSGIRDSSV